MILINDDIVEKIKSGVTVGGVFLDYFVWTFVEDCSQFKISMKYINHFYSNKSKKNGPQLLKFKIAIKATFKITACLYRNLSKIFNKIIFLGSP